MKHHHNRELNMRRFERRWIQIRSLKWMKRQAHKESRRNAALALLETTCKD